jgi:flagellar biosynthetic protein FlhB
MAEAEERTERATPRRRQKAREKGQVARSRELASMAGTAGVLILFYAAGENFLGNLSGLTGRLLSLSYGKDPVSVMTRAGAETLWVIMPFMVVATSFGVLVSVAQGGFLVKPVDFEMNRLNPLSGLKRLVSREVFVEFLKSLFKFMIGVALFYFIMVKAVATLPFTAGLDFREVERVSFGFIGKALAYVFATFFVLAVLDYGVQRWKFERSLRMSREEVKEEYKEIEGDPLIKSRIKALQRETARRRMMQEVPKATVVITNPTHIAVALRYKGGETAAPKVIAKGQGFVAQRIKEIAKEHSVPVVEDKPLARALHKLELGVLIPEELYKAVARILAYIYRLRGVA